MQAHNVAGRIQQGERVVLGLTANRQDYGWLGAVHLCCTVPLHAICQCTLTVVDAMTNCDSRLPQARLFTQSNVHMFQMRTVASARDARQCRHVMLLPQSRQEPRRKCGCEYVVCVWC